MTRARVPPIATTLMLGALLVATLAGAGAGEAREQALSTLHARPAPSPLLGFVGRDLARLDPLSLAARPGRKLAVPFNVYAWTFSPDRRRLVVGDNGAGRLLFVDAVRLRSLGTVQLPGPAVTAIAWANGRVVAATSAGEGVRLHVIDPVRR